MSVEEQSAAAAGSEDEQSAHEVTEEVPDEEVSDGSSMIALPSGEAFSYTEASAAMKITPGKVILVAGENDAGKTSLLCALYERFLRGEFASQRFAGSQTLRAFEQRCFLQRVESGQDKPDMERTRLPTGELALLHLELEAKSSGERLAVLATDLAGEAFRLIRDNPEECKRYPVLARVDCVTVLLDADRLRTPAERHGHINTTRTMLRSLLQSQSVPRRVPIILAISKSDLLSGKAECDKAIVDAKDVLAVVGENPTELLRIAAAPEQDTPPGDYGLSELLRRWLAAVPPASQLPVGVEVGAPQSTAPFDTFGVTE